MTECAVVQHAECLPADVHAADLGLRLNGPMPKILAEQTFSAADTESSLHLAVIGASHVATVRGHGGILFREEISCHATESAGGRGLPEVFRQRGYDLVSRGSRLSPAGFSLAAERIAAGGSDWLIVSFPGIGEHHLTAVKGEFGPTGSWRWWTRHLYPEESTIVSTRSRYTP